MGPDLPVLQHAIDVSHVLLSHLLHLAEGGAAGNQKRLHRRGQADPMAPSHCLCLRCWQPEQAKHWLMHFANHIQCQQYPTHKVALDNPVLHQRPDSLPSQHGIICAAQWQHRKYTLVWGQLAACRAGSSTVVVVMPGRGGLKGGRGMSCCSGNILLRQLQLHQQPHVGRAAWSGLRSA